jgi:hypothetical protein
MRRSLLKFLLMTAALASVAPTLACQPRVVLLRFNAPDLGSNVDRVFVKGITPSKDVMEMSGFQVIGYYNVSTPSIKVRIWVCSEKDELLAYQESQNRVDHDEVTFVIDAMIDSHLDDLPSCHKALARLDAGSNNSGSGGGTGDGGAGNTNAGAGGSAAGGAGGGALGGSGVGGTSGTDGGAADTAECGIDTHAPVCDPPSGDPGDGGMPDPPAISPACIQYCSDVRSKCGAVYDSDDSCQRYCARAGWAGTDLGSNSLACRNTFLNGPVQLTCSNVGPSGGSSGGCGYPCPNFCAAWISICNPDPGEASACMAACSMNTVATRGADPACRFQLLERALYDKRYCEHVKYGSCFSCE